MAFGDPGSVVDYRNCYAYEVGHIDVWMADGARVAVQWTRSRNGCYLRHAVWCSWCMRFVACRDTVFEDPNDEERDAILDEFFDHPCMRGKERYRG